MTDRLTTLLIEVLARALAFFFGLLAARVLGVDEFGVWSLLFAVASYLILIAEFSALQLGVRELAMNGDPRPSLRPIMGARLIGFSISIGCSIFLWVFGVFQGEVGIYLCLVPVAALFNFEFLYRGEKNVKYAAFQSFLLSFLPLLFLFSFQKEIVNGDSLLLMRTIVWIFVGIAMFHFYSERRFSDIFEFRVPENLLSYTQVLLGALLARLYFNSDVVLIAFLLDSKAVGHYSAVTILYFAFVSLRQVIVNTTYPSLCESYTLNAVVYKHMVIRYSLGFTVIVAPALIGGFIFSGELIELLFGPEYLSDQVVEVFKIYLGVFLLLAIGLLVPNTLHVQGKSHLFLYLTGIAALLNLLINIVFLERYGIVAAAWSTLVAEAVVIVGSAITLWALQPDR